MSASDLVREGGRKWRGREEGEGREGGREGGRGEVERVVFSPL